MKNATAARLPPSLRLLLQLGKPRAGQLLLTIDWTEWHHDLRLLVVAVVTGKRGLPLWVQGTPKLVRQRSQNAYEHTFARLLADILKRAGVRATLLCDRGFRRVSWISMLQKLKLGFVVRLKDDVCVTWAGNQQTLKALSATLPRGKVIDLGEVPLRSDDAVRTRVIFYWARNAHEPWWLATDCTDSPSTVVKFYDRRMTVEEQFRDTKGRRFGVKLYWTRFRNPDHLARFVMLLGVALLLWSITGRRAAARDPSLRMTGRARGPRQSFITIGRRIFGASPFGLAITVAIMRRWLEPPQFRPLRRKGLGAAK